MQWKCISYNISRVLFMPKQTCHISDKWCLTGKKYSGNTDIKSWQNMIIHIYRYYFISFSINLLLAYRCIDSRQLLQWDSYQCIDEQNFINIFFKYRCWRTSPFWLCCQLRFLSVKSSYFIAFNKYMKILLYLAYFNFSFIYSDLQYLLILAEICWGQRMHE